MPLYINSDEEMYATLRSTVSGEIPELTNFTQGSPEYTLLHGMGEYLYVLEHARAAAQLSGWVDFAGGPVAEEDIRDLYPPGQREDVDLQLLNSFMSPYDLEQLGELVGVDRDPGDYATGYVTLQTARGNATIEAGRIFATTAEETGQYLEFAVVNDTEVGADATARTKVKATQRGDEYNVGSHTIEYIPDTSEYNVTVNSVTNEKPTSGGEDREPNSEYRKRIKRALTHASAGGTVAGIKGKLVELFDGVMLGDVYIDEFFDTKRTLTWHGDTYTVDTSADVYVRGGPSDQRLQEAIDKYRPTAILHILRRPYFYETDITIEAAGTGIRPNRIEGAISTYITELDLGENLVDVQLTQAILQEGEQVEDFSIKKTVNREPHTYQSGTQQYKLRSQAESVGKVEGVVNGNTTTFTEGEDYVTKDTDGDTEPDTVDFSPSGTNAESPDDGTEFYITYTAPDDIYVRKPEAVGVGAIDVQVKGPDPTDVA